MFLIRKDRLRARKACEMLRSYFDAQSFGTEQEMIEVFISKEFVVNFCTSSNKICWQEFINVCKNLQGMHNNF